MKRKDRGGSAMRSVMDTTMDSERYGDNVVPRATPFVGKVPVLGDVASVGLLATLAKMSMAGHAQHGACHLGEREREQEWSVSPGRESRKGKPEGDGEKKHW